MQMTLPGMGEGMELADRARDWTRENREAWWHMCMAATRYAEDGRRFGIAELFEEVRWHLRTEGKDGGFKCNNSLRAPLARLMAAQYPQVAPYLETRKSKVDGLL